MWAWDGVFGWPWYSQRRGGRERHIAHMTGRPWPKTPCNRAPGLGPPSRWPRCFVGRRRQLWWQRARGNCRILCRRTELPNRVLELGTGLVRFDGWGRKNKPRPCRGRMQRQTLLPLDLWNGTGAAGGVALGDRVGLGGLWYGGGLRWRVE